MEILTSVNDIICVPVCFSETFKEAESQEFGLLVLHILCKLMYISVCLLIMANTASECLSGLVDTACTVCTVYFLIISQSAYTY